jgi:hypothetical protein
MIVSSGPCRTWIETRNCPDACVLPGSPRGSGLVQGMKESAAQVSGRPEIIANDGRAERASFAASVIKSGGNSTAPHVYQSQTTLTKKRPDFQAFMDAVLRENPGNPRIHVILDNDATHKRNDACLAAHPHVRFHFTLTSVRSIHPVSGGSREPDALWTGSPDCPAFHTFRA